MAPPVLRRKPLLSSPDRLSLSFLQMIMAQRFDRAYRGSMTGPLRRRGDLGNGLSFLLLKMIMAEGFDRAYRGSMTGPLRRRWNLVNGSVQTRRSRSPVSHLRHLRGPQRNSGGFDDMSRRHSRLRGRC